MVKFSNPLAFTRGPVTVFVSLVYIAVFTILIIIETGPPTPPSAAVPYAGINLTEAWDDLQTISAEFHPFNSRRNDWTRAWLLSRIKDILESNAVNSTAAYVFDDQTSNLTFTSSGSASSVYFESLNIVVYVRGEDDDKTEWWNTTTGKPKERNGVLVNAHFDSVSTGYGATDDGVGVISVLQLLKYFTTKGNTPKHGLVLLLNNGEEDFLNGAFVFSQNPMSKFVSSFLNLEGAGAGGRATLFRSTDEEVTQAYAKSPYPYGTVISGDAFNKGLIRSQTDYVVFNGKLGMRGLDVAFFEPRSRYHTDQDDSRHTGKGAVWHMLSAAVATTKQLTISGIKVDDSAHSAMWFDFFGRALLCMQSHTFFALSVAALVVGPILLFSTLGLLYRIDKQYLFSGARKFHGVDADETISIYGYRGFFRFPLLLAFSCAPPVALAYLLFKVNPYIAHGNEWAVWSMMIASFVFIAWFFARAFDYARPSALTRAYGYGWLCVIWWALLVGAAVFEEQFHLSGGYFTLFYFTCILLATFLSYLELASLPKKQKYCTDKLGDSYPVSRSRSASRPVSQRSTHEEGEAPQANTNDEANERSSLLRSRGRSAFKNYSNRNDADQDQDPETDESKVKIKGALYNEQEWSKSMWSWVWILQFILAVPLNLIILGELGIFLVAALHQTGQDGSSMFTVYLSMSILTIFLFMPILPLVHRFTYHVPMFLFLVLAGTVLYNLLAFPFSSQNRLKLFFQHEIDLTTGANNISLKGISPYVKTAIADIPSAAGQNVTCTTVSGYTNIEKCVWSGEIPQVVSDGNLDSTKWVDYTASLIHIGDNSKTARFVVQGKNTRGCKIYFNTTISDFRVEGQAPVDSRIPVINSGKTSEVRLWHREWDESWTVNITWKYTSSNDTGLSGKVACIWSDANNGIISSLDEVKHYVPVWVAISKAADGLVEGSKAFVVPREIAKPVPEPLPSASSSVVTTLTIIPTATPTPSEPPPPPSSTGFTTISSSEVVIPPPQPTETGPQTTTEPFQTPVPTETPKQEGSSPPLPKDELKKEKVRR